MRDTQRKKVRLFVVPAENTSKIDPIIEFHRALHLKTQAEKDQIFVYFWKEDNTMLYRVNKTVCRTFEGALIQVRSLQSQLAPSDEVRS